jgi:hypothetical protein
MAAPVMSQSALSPELAQGLPPEFLEIIAPQFQVTNPKRGMNPMFVLAIGGAGVLLLMLVAALATIFLSNS